MRIRTDGDKSWRKDEIESAAEFYERNKTASVVRACRDVPALVDGVLDVLERDDLTPRQKQEIASTLSTKYLQFDVDESVGADIHG